MLTTLYGPNQAEFNQCKSMTMWLDTDPKFITYKIKTLALYPNNHMFVHEELTDSCQTDFVRTLKAPLESTTTVGFCELNTDDQGSFLIYTQLLHVDKDPLVEEIRSVCSKLVDEPPTLESILGDCRMKFALPKYDRKWNDLVETKQLNYLHKYINPLKGYQY